MLPQWQNTSARSSPRTFVAPPADSRVSSVYARGQLGNKGGIGVTFRLCDTTFLFVNAHLAAGQKAVRLRNQDFHRIQAELLKYGLP